MATLSCGLSLTASWNFLLEWALSRARDKAHYPDSVIIQSGARNPVSGALQSEEYIHGTPDNGVTVFEGKQGASAMAASVAEVLL